MSERKLSDWLASNHFEDYAAAARALEAERRAFMLESQRKEIEANELAAEVARLRDAVEHNRQEFALLFEKRDALRAKLDAVRAVCDGDVECEMGTGHLYVYLDDICAALDGEGDHEA